MHPDLEQGVQRWGAELLAKARSSGRTMWATARWEEKLLRRIMASGTFKVQALRFLDVLPALHDDAELLRHLREYFRDDALGLPGMLRWGMRRIGGGETSRKIGAAAVRKAVRGMATRFITGEDEETARKSVFRLRRRGMAFTLDLLGEVTMSEPEAERYQRRYLALLERVHKACRNWDPNDLPDAWTGPDVSPAGFSIKLSSLYSRLDPADMQGSVRGILDRLRPVFRRAKDFHVSICVDMEHFQYKDIILHAFMRILEEEEFRAWTDVGIALQAYLTCAERDLRTLLAWVRKRGAPIAVRLVRGAYWDYETVLGAQCGWEIPVWMSKQETDMCYERCLQLLFEQRDCVYTAVATHNVRSIALAMALAERHRFESPEYEFQMLYGMADPLKDALVEMGCKVRVYAPFGELIPGMAYLVRRMLENTASQSFLRMGFAEDASADVLLAKPEVKKGGAADDGTVRPDRAFRNEALRRFTSARERRDFSGAVERVKRQLGLRYAPVIAGKPVPGRSVFASVNPARPGEVIGEIVQSEIEHAERALDAARRAFPDWKKRGASHRAEILLRAADIMRAKRDVLSAWEILEAGKTWREADADVVEAIDFLEFYAREAVRLEAGEVLDVPGEINRCLYEPCGVGVVIPPWNFPLAIVTGMLAAAIVSGNTAILKPAPQTPVTAAKLMDVLQEAGLPDGVVAFLPETGATVGEFLVSQPEIHFISFTGSTRVGTHIHHVASALRDGQTHLKRVIAEMGGKNAVIVDGDADLDDAVGGVLKSAFGFQGQKCSACSRVIPVGPVHDAFLDRLVEGARSLAIGMPEDPATFMGPVIDRRSYDRIHRAIAQGKRSARLALEVDTRALGEGYFIGPTIFSEVRTRSSLAREEIFGPVLAVMRARTFEQALAYANDTDYALTGGVYSRSPGHLEMAKERFQVGNLYLNRKITGAVVGRQPFGGFKLSGMGSKAGGCEYLKQFMRMRTITENTMRRGFAATSDGDFQEGCF